LLEEAVEGGRVVVPTTVFQDIRSEFREAILCVPCDPVPHLEKALHHARFGEIVEALRHAEVAQGLQFTSPLVHDRVGRIYWTLSRFGTAESSDWRRRALVAFEESLRRDSLNFGAATLNYLRFQGVKERELEPLLKYLY
jgi:hypothetical protein